MAPKPTPVACERRSVLVEPRLHLALLELPFVDRPKPKDKWRPGEWLAAALDTMSLVPLKDAYVMVWTPGQDDVRLARTSDTGELVLIRDAEVGAATPKPEPKRLCDFEPGVAYELFWTTDEGVFAAALDDRRKSMDVFRFHGVTLTFVNRPAELFDRDPQKHFGLGDANDARLGWLLEAIERDEPAGYLTSDDRWKASLGYDTFGMGEGRFLLARRPALDALRVAELLVGGYLDIRQQAARSDAIFALGDEMVRTGAKETPLAGDLALYTSAPVNAEYTAYTYKCANAGVERRLFYDALPTSSLRNEPWLAAGRTIQAEHPEVGEHPNAHRPMDVIDVDRAKRRFDLRRFSQDHPETRPWRSSTHHVQKLLEKQAGDLEVLVRGFFEKFAPWDAVLRDLGARTPACTPDDVDDLHYRYVSMAAALGVPLTDHIEESKIPNFAPYVLWFTTAFDKGGGSFDFLFNDASHILSRERLATAHQAAEVLRRDLRKFTKLARAGNVPTVDYASEFGGKMHVDFAAGTVTVQTKKGKAIGELRFGRSPMPSSGRSAWAHDLVRSKPTIEVTVPKLTEHSIPRRIGAFGSAAGFGLGLWTASEDLRTKDNVLVYGRLGQNAVQSIDAVSSASEFVKHKLVRRALGEAGELALRPVGAGLEGFFNVREGMSILVEADAETGPTHGLLVFKGYVLMSSGSAAVGSVGIGALTGGFAALGATETAMGAAFIAAAAPAFAVAGMAVAVGAIVVLGLDVTKYLIDGPSGSLSWLEDELGQACKDEYGANLLEKSEKAGATTYTISKTWERGEAFLRDAQRAIKTVG
ncbi:MAG TPA: hypothetical protein VH560_00355 [Polyangia bacterium]|jgi:hypothetical protein|nr:hypothetical protein [Polyangia bacterium]